MNKVVLIGNLTKDPETNTTKDGLTVCKMSIAVNRNFSNANGEREADFFTIVAWRQLAENCGKYLSKGKKIAVSGSLQNRSWETQSGERRYTTEINADGIDFLSPRSDAETPETDRIPAPVKKNNHGLTPVESDDLPF